MKLGLRSLLGAASLDSPPAEILWSTTYFARLRRTGAIGPRIEPTGEANNVWCFPPPVHNLTVDDDVIEEVESVWKAVGGEPIEEEGFLRFEPRQNEEDVL